MVDAIISPILEQLTSMAVDEAKEQVRLVTGVGKEAEKLTRKLRTIQTVLHDAEKRQIKEETVRLWLDQLRDACYDMEDVLGEWNTARLKLQIDGVDDHENDALVPKKAMSTSLCIELNVGLHSRPVDLCLSRHMKYEQGGSSSRRSDSIQQRSNQFDVK